MPWSSSVLSHGSRWLALAAWAALWAAPGSAAEQAAAPPLEDIALSTASRVTHDGTALVIRNPEAKRVAVAVHDARGRPVFSRRYGSSAGRCVTVPTDGYPAGVYVFTVRVADSVFTRPFIVTR